MKKLIVCLLLCTLCLSVGGCGESEVVPQQEPEVVEDVETQTKTDTEQESEEVETLPMNYDDGVAEKADVEDEEEVVEVDEVWQQCLDMQENAVLETPVELSIKGVVIDQDWTLSDFLTSGLIPDDARIEVKSITESGDSIGYTTTSPSTADLMNGVNGIFVSVITEDFLVSFDAASAGIEESPNLSTMDLPLVHIIGNKDWVCNGVTPEFTKEDVVKTLGPTRWSDDSMVYMYKDSSKYIGFKVGEDDSLAVFWDIGA